MWKRRILPLLFGLLTVVVLAGVRIADPYPTRILREIAFDNFQRVAPRVPAGSPITIVDVDDESLKLLGQWPWPRDLMARLTDRLTQLGAASIAFDMIFPEPDRMSPTRIANDLNKADPGLNIDAASLVDFDQEMANSLSQSPSVLGFGATPSQGEPPPTAKSGFAVVGPNPVAQVPRLKGTVNSLPVLVDAAKGLGSISLAPDGDVGTIRRLPLLWSDGTSLYTSLSIESLRIAMRASTIVVFSDDKGSGQVSSVRIGNFEIPTDASGAMWLYYHKSDPGLYVSASKILGDDYQMQAAAIGGHIILIGTSATGLLDIRGTPMGESMPGVEVHAQALDQMISGKFLLRADWVSGLELLTFILLGLLMVVTLLWSGPATSVLVGGVAAIVVVGGSWLAFVNWGMLVDPTFPLGAAFLVYTAMIFFRFLISDSDKRMIRSAFGHYVAPALLAKIEANSDSVKLGGEVRDLSVLFLDIRNFTTLSEGLEPGELVHLLNTMFGALGACITDESGTIDKFIGDAIMAFWNAPVDVEEHARHACVASLAMRNKMKTLNARDAFGLYGRDSRVKSIAIGIGVATGKALVGNLGLETRFDYSCVGDTVNVASRVEDACKAVNYDIVVSDSTRREVADLAFLEAGSVALKGKSVREKIHILVGDTAFAASPEFKRLHVAHREAIALILKSEDANAAIDTCINLVPGNDAGLVHFYERLKSRLDDFRLAEQPTEPLPQPA
ncbi:MAG: adenylate/guanylate cyclase domain-containing protein [Hyphomicrobiaceae bacterium]|nr:adenylate/guanylate cyclase domain-containing protein [Hyphomicrobiaceae bacterium]